MKMLLKTSLVITCSTALLACGGGGSGATNNNSNGSGSNNSITDKIPTTTSLPTLDGLSNDAGKSYPLLYIDTPPSNNIPNDFPVFAKPRLMAYDPSSDTTTIRDGNLSLPALVSSSIFPLALHSAAVDASDGTVSNYQIDNVAYVQGDLSLIPLPAELMKININNNHEPVQVSNEKPETEALHQMVAFNLAKPEKSQYVYPAKEDTATKHQYKLITLDTDATEPAKKFGEGFSVQTPLTHTKTDGPFGWLIADQNQDDCLALVENTQLTQARCIPNARDNSNVVLVQDGDMFTSNISGIYPLNNGTVLAVPEKNSSGDSMTVITTLWFYEYGQQGEVGKLHRLKNSDGESLITSGLAMFSPNQAGLAVSKNGDTLYLAAGDGGIGALLGGGNPSNPLDIKLQTFLHKITTTPGNIGWETIWHKGGSILDETSEPTTLGDFLVDAGNQLLWEINEKLIAISLDGQQETILDGRRSSGSSLIRGAFVTPIGVVSEAGWFFYNREDQHSDFATAVKVDGSQRLELKNCTWLGASTNGQAQYVGGNFASLQPSEVFMACNKEELAAVDANAPLNGRVILGKLPKKADEIEMGKTAPGPHRLLRSTYKNAAAAESYEVVYVNTRHKNSLKHLLNEAANEDTSGSGAGVTRPVNGF